MEFYTLDFFYGRHFVLKVGAAVFYL